MSELGYLYLKPGLKLRVNFAIKFFQLIWDARKNGILSTDRTSIIMEHICGTYDMIYLNFVLLKT